MLPVRQQNQGCLRLVPRGNPSERRVLVLNTPTTRYVRVHVSNLRTPRGLLHLHPLVVKSSGLLEGADPRPREQSRLRIATHKSRASYMGRSKCAQPLYRTPRDRYIIMINYSWKTSGASHYDYTVGHGCSVLQVGEVRPGYQLTKYRRI